MAVSVGQPISGRVDELLSGVKAQLAIKLFGEDLDILEVKGREILAAVQDVTGSADVQMDQLSGEEQLVVHAALAQLARYGLNVADVMEVVSTAIGGEAVTNVLEGQRRFAGYLRVAERFRSDPEAISRLWVANKDGVRAAEEALAQQSSPQAIGQMGIGKVMHGKVVSLAGRLPHIWTDPATTDAQRKALLRCLVDKVVLDRGEHDVALVRIVWRGGAVSTLDVKMKVNSVARRTRGTEMRHRALELARNGMPDNAIAALLTGEGHRSPTCENTVLPITVGQIRRGAGIKVTKPRNRWSHCSSLLSAPEIPSRLNIPVNWIHVQIRKKRLLIERQPSGAYLFHDSQFVLDAVRNLRNHALNCVDLRSCQPHQEGH